MSSDHNYTPDTNNPRWPLWAMATFALICCIVFWRSCEFAPESGGDAPAPAASEQAQ